MLRYRNTWGGAGFLTGRMTFMAPDTGANASTGTGGAGTQSAGNGAAGNGGTPDVTSQPKNAWDAIPWDELDAGVRATLETARTDHQRVASENATLQEQERTRQQQQRQQQQQPKPVDPNAPKPNPIEDRIRENLKAQGLNQQQIDSQAPGLAALFGAVLPEFKKSIGSELAPLANTVISQQNYGNFEQATQTREGQTLFQDPALAQEVWNIVQQQTSQGRVFDPEAILNVAKMQYFDRQMAAGQPAPQPITAPSSSTFFPTVNQLAPVNRSTGFNFPGSYGIRPATGSVNTDPNGPKHASNADTQAALAQTFAELKRTTGVAPKAFAGK